MVQIVAEFRALMGSWGQESREAHALLDEMQEKAEDLEDLTEEEEEELDELLGKLARVLQFERLEREHKKFCELLRPITEMGTKAITIEWLAQVKKVMGGK